MSDLREAGPGAHGGPAGVAVPAPSPDVEPVLVVDALRVELDGRPVPIVDDVSFSLRPGEVLGLVGESGSGKTTVALALLGHARRGAHLAGGSILLQGREVRTLDPGALRRLRGASIAYMPQDPGTALSPATRVGSLLEQHLRVHGIADPAARRARVAEVLEEVGLPADRELLRRFPHQLSGGQQQRLALAVAFACQPAVVVLDEPTTGLDVATQARVLETLGALCSRHGTAAVYVSHDLAVVASLARRVAVLYGGQLVELATAAHLFTRPRHPYTAALIDAAPDPEGRRVLLGIPGSTPRPGSWPSGCPFAPRCPRAAERCEEELPPLDRLGGEPSDHLVRCWLAAEEPAADLAGAPLAEGVGEGRRAARVEDPVLLVSDFTASYGGREVVHRMSLAIGRGECVALVGESGSGKTTLARAIAGLLPSHTGRIEVGGEVLARRARDRTREQLRKVQYVFQNPYASLNPRWTVRDTLAAAFRQLVGSDARAAEEAVRTAMDEVALEERQLDRYPDELSGGERQRVAIARSLIVRPAVLLCDEVTSALDVSVQAVILALLDQLRRDHALGMLFVTHNLPLVRTIAQRVLVLRAGAVVEEGSTDQVLGQPEHPYTRFLLGHSPILAAPTPPLGEGEHSGSGKVGAVTHAGTAMNERSTGE